MGGGKENGQKACLWSLETPIPHSGSTLREIDPKNGMAFSMMQKAEDHIHGGGKKKRLSRSCTTEAIGPLNLTKE